VLTATGTTALLWKKRPKPLHGSRKFHEMFQALRPSLLGRLEARAPAREQCVPLHRLQVDVDAHFLEVLLDQLVHRERQHLPRARRRDEVHRLGGMLGAVEAGLAQQILRLRRVVLVDLPGLAEPRVALVDDAGGGNARVVQQALADADAIDGVVGRLPHELVVPRLLVQTQRVRPVVGVGVQRDLKAAALELRDRIRRRHFDPVHLAAAQRGQARGRLGHRQQHEAVDLGRGLGFQ